MAETPASDCDSEPVCKRLKTDLELTFASHLELTNQLGAFEDSTPVLNNHLDSENTATVTTDPDPSLPNGEKYIPSIPETNAISMNEVASTSGTNEEVPIPVTDPPNNDNDNDEAVADATLSTEEPDTATPKPSKLVPEENKPEQDEVDTKVIEPTQSAEEEKDKTESQESGSDEVEVVQTKVKTKKTKTANQRKEIRKILTADQLEEDTLKAQREEAERRQRQRLLQRQQNMSKLGQNWQFSVEDVMKRMAHKGITMTLASESMISPDSNSNLEIDINNKPDISTATEQEVFTLSSDDEDSDFSAKQSDKYKSLFGGPTPLPQDFYSGGVIMNNCGGVVSDVLIDGLKNMVSEIPGGSKAIDKGAESDSSDDCVVISPPPINDEEDGSIEKYDDENNIPDELGRVLVNVGHPKEDPDIFLSTHIGKAVKPHQIGGIRFLYDNVVESMERFKSTGGLGCILAHSMGLGKTIQAAAFCDVFLRHTSANTVLVIVPINTVQNWLNEFNQWLPQTHRIDSTTSTPTTRKYVRRKAKLKAAKNQDNQDLDQLKQKNPEQDLPEELKMNPDNLDDLKCSESISVPTPPTTTSEEQSMSTSNPSSLPPQSLSESPEASVLSVPEPAETSEVPITENVGVVPCEGRSFGVYVLNETVKTLAAREKIISEWSENRGVLLIGYEMYRMLSLKKLKKTAKREKVRMDSPEEENARLLKANQEENMLTKIYSCLVRPGPDLVICDEGHRIKNSGASISQALKAIKTRRRVVLTGYPLQNNLMEYWCMVDFIRPSYLGSKAEFSNMFERPITNGQCADSTAGDKRLMQYRSHVLHSLLEGFVQRRSHVVLQKALPAKQEWVFLLKMTPIQYELYKEFISYLRLLADMGNSTPNPIKAFAVCCKIWNHPDVLYNVVKKKQSILDDFEGLTEEVEDNKVRKNGVKKVSKMPVENMNTSDMNDNNYYGRIPQVEDLDPNTFPIFTNYGYGSRPGPSPAVRDNRTADSLLSLEWAASAFKNYVPGHLENGTKFELLFIIIEECTKVNDRLLVFSQSLLTLDLMETFLNLKFSWVKGRDYFRLDGSTGGLERERLIKDFNTPSSTAHVFLVSTRAGSLGINLIGANRVVVFDASWNPCHDCQAVCRVYRYGQKKECQIYRFVTDCTLEKRIYDRQINKRGMANRVVDEMNPDSHFNSKDMSSTLHLEMDELDRVQETTFEQDPMNFDDVIMQNVLSKAGDKITKEPFEHESLLIDRKEKKLSPSERRMAHRNYEFEKKAATNPVPGPTPTVVNRQPYPSYFPGYQGQGVQLTKHGHSGMNGMSYDESGNSYMYGASGQTGGYYDKPIASVRPIRQEMGFNHERDEMSMSNTARDREAPPLPVDELRRKGVSVQGIILRRDSFLADPEGGPDIFLREGDKVYLLRSYKGSYLRLSNGRIIALRRRARTNLLDHIPPTQDLTKEQILLVINSIFKPRTSSSSNYGHEPDYHPSHSIHRNYRRKVEEPVFSGDVNQFPYHHSMSVPLPPTHPYGDFLNHQQNLQITNQRSSSGGDVTIWKQDGQAGQSKVRKASEVDLIPDIEVIKLNPTENGSQKGYTKIQPPYQGQPLPKNIPLIRNPFSRPPVSTPISNHLYHSAQVPESRKNPAVVNALLSGGHWQRQQVQKSFRSHSSSSSNTTNPLNFTTQSIPIQRKSPSPVPLPSELTIQPVPGRPHRAGSNDSHSSPLRNFNPSWISPGSSTTSNKTQFQNFDRFSPPPNIAEQYYSPDNSGNGSDFLEAGQELLSELMNPTQSYNFNRSIGNAQSTQQFAKHDIFPNVLNSFHGRIPNDGDAIIDSESFLTNHKQMSENGLSGVGSGDDNVFHENSYENGSGSAAANMSLFGQYFCRNPGISTAENSQSFTPHS